MDESTYEFTLIARPLNADPAELYDRLEEQAVRRGALEDAALGMRDGAIVVEFAREAPSLAVAIATGIKELESLVPKKLVVTRVEPDDLVSGAEVARRMGRTREGVRLLAAGDRGPRGFPIPWAWTRTDERPARMWRWSEVARWITEHEVDVDPPPGTGWLVREAWVPALVNNWLDVRFLKTAADPYDRKEIENELAAR